MKNHGKDAFPISYLQAQGGEVLK